MKKEERRKYNKKYYLEKKKRWKVYGATQRSKNSYNIYMNKYMKKRRKHPETRASVLKIGRNASVKYRKNNQKKYRCRMKYQHAIKFGILIRKPCSVCFETKVDGHHYDYNKPLSVIWLCHKHHIEIHGGFPSG